MEDKNITQDITKTTEITATQELIGECCNCLENTVVCTKAEYEALITTKVTMDFVKFILETEQYAADNMLRKYLGVQAPVKS